jgi:hypothetical protein
MDSPPHSGPTSGSGPPLLLEWYPALFSHSIHPNACVSLVLSSGLSQNLVPRLSHAATADLLMLSSELASVALSSDSSDIRLARLTNKMLSNKDFYSFTFRHLQIDELATRIWKSAPP